MNEEIIRIIIREELHAFFAAIAITRECRKCGCQFAPKRSDAMYCSAACKVAAHRARKVKP